MLLIGYWKQILSSVPRTKKGVLGLKTMMMTLEQPLVLPQNRGESEHSIMSCMCRCKFKKQLWLNLISFLMYSSRASVLSHLILIILPLTVGVMVS